MIEIPAPARSTGKRIIKKNFTGNLVFTGDRLEIMVQGCQDGSANKDGDERQCTNVKIVCHIAELTQKVN